VWPSAGPRSGGWRRLPSTGSSDCADHPASTMHRSHLAWAPVAVLLTLLSVGIRAQHPPDIRETLAALSSKSQDRRDEAVKQLAARVQAEPAVRARADVHLAIARLIRQEGQQLIRIAFEGFEPDTDLYDWHIVPAAMSILSDTAPRTKPVVVAALVESSIFNSGSKLSQAIAEVGDSALPAILRASAGPDIYKSSNAFDLLGRMLASHRTGALRQPLSANSEAAARRALLRGLRHTDIVCRREAVRGVERAGLREAVPVLRELAATDPDDGRGRNGPLRFSVRGLAANALATLSKEP
jgi:hypothetical protein